MASFTREDYEKVYKFAAWSYVALKRKKNGANMREFAVEIMDLCESAIGQQSTRPDRES